MKLNQGKILGLIYQHVVVPTDNVRELHPCIP